MANDKLNVVFIMTDDQGYGDMGFTGNEVIITPHMDQLAQESVWLEDYHTAPSCYPTVRGKTLPSVWSKSLNP